MSTLSFSVVPSSSADFLRTRSEANFHRYRSYPLPDARVSYFVYRERVPAENPFWLSPVYVSYCAQQLEYVQANSMENLCTEHGLSPYLSRARDCCRHSPGRQGPVEDHKTLRGYSIRTSIMAPAFMGHDPDPRPRRNFLDTGRPVLIASKILEMNESA